MQTQYIENKTAEQCQNISSFSRKLISTIEKRPYFYAFCIIAIMTLLRLWFIATNQLDLSPDEAQYWDWSRTLQLSYYSKGPLISWNIAIWTSLFGDTAFAIRFGAVFNSVVSQCILFFGVAKLFKRPVLALLCLFVANTMPLFLASAILMTTDSPLLVCWLLAFFSLYVVGGKDSKLAYFILFLAMAFGCLAKYMMFAFFATAIPYLLILYKHKIVDFKKIKIILFVMLLGSIIGLLPIVLWNAQNDWVGFLHVTSLAGVTGSKASKLFNWIAVPEFIGSQLGVAAPWWWFIAFVTSLRYAKTSLKKSIHNKEEVHTLHFTKLTFVEVIRQQSLLACGFLVLLGGFFIWSFHTNIYANWPAMAYVAGIILAASGFENILYGYTSPKIHKILPVLMTCALTTSFLLYLQSFIPIPENIDPTIRLKGWSNLSEKLEEMQMSFEDPEKVFYFSSRYDTTAALSFYSPKKERSYDANFDNRLSQYDLWENPSDGENKIGWNALYISKKTDLPLEYFENNLGQLFEEIKFIPYVTKHKGGIGEDFLLIKCYNYNGNWPKQVNLSY